MENFHFVTCILEVPKKKAGLNIYDPFFWGGVKQLTVVVAKDGVGWRATKDYETK